MNLFLLFAAPLATFLTIAYFLESVPRHGVWKPLTLGAIAGLILVIFAGWFDGLWGPSAHFAGTVWHYWAGDFAYFLLPLLGWFFFKGGKIGSQGELLLVVTIGLGALYTVLGVRDFFMTRPRFDDIELFFIPIIRILLIAGVPPLFLEFVNSRTTASRLLLGSLLLGITIGFSLILGLKELHLHFWAWFALSASCGLIGWRVHRYFDRMR